MTGAAGKPQASGGERITGEEDIIERFLRPLAAAPEFAFDFRDDAALLKPRPGTELVITADMLVGGVHFLPDDRPEDIAIKATTANLSDLVGKGATPVGYILTLSLPKDVNADWLDGFASGLAPVVGGQLLGGDLTATSGPVTISITAIGEVPCGKMVHRFGGKPGDRVFLSGPVGNSWLGLKVYQDLPWAKRVGMSAETIRSFVECYMRPTVWEPALTARLIREHAAASMDVSDGLVKDLRRLCAASGTGARISVQQVPIAPHAQELVREGHVTFADLFTGGDDYCALITVRPSRLEAFRAALAKLKDGLIRFHEIGELTDRAHGCVFQTLDGGELPGTERGGFDHF